MNSKKKQTVAIAMATIFGASGLMSPVAVYAQEELVNVQKRIEESQIKQNVSQQPVTIDNGGIPVSGNIDINETNFPDKEFRDWIKTNITGADDDVLTPDEISNIKRIDVSNKSEIKNLKGIEHFTALEELYCHSTGITTLDVSKNTLLKYFSCNNTNITTLDVLNNEQLTYLSCGFTDITTLDVSKNTQLTNLSCSSTGITILDVSKNEQLTELYCYSTGITILDVSKNKQLTKLYCDNTDITTLDISKNNQLTYLDCTNTPLAFLKLGSLNVSNGFYVPSSTTASLTVTSASFDITQIFPGIETAKISNVQGADLDGNIVKGYSVGTPITYTYYCGTNNGMPVKLDVTLNLSISKTDSIIAIIGSLDTTYNGKPIEKPTVSKIGSTGDVNFTYQVKNGDRWDKYNDTPINAGIYRVTAHLAEDDFYKDAETTKEFTISPKDIKDGNITVSDISNDRDVEKLIVKDDNKVLVKGTDYEVETKEESNKTTVTISFKGNYVGTIEKNFTVKQEQKPQNQPKDTGSVKTGDSTYTGLLAMLSMMSAGCIALLAGKKRKKNVKEDETTPL